MKIVRIALLLLLSFSCQVLVAQSNVDTTAARKMLETASQQINAGQYQQALENAQQALSIYQDKLGEQHELTAEAYYLVGNADQYLPTGKAADWFGKALAIQEKLFGKKDLRTVRSQVRLGSLKVFIGDNQAVITILDEALQTQEALPQKDTAILTMTYYYLAGAYANTGNQDKALTLYFRNIPLSVARSGANSVPVALMYNGIAECYRVKGEYASALPYYQKTLAIFEKILPPNHSNFVVFNQTIGQCYMDMKEYEQALKYLHKSVAINLVAFGSNHASTGLAYNKIGMLYLRIRQPDKALQYYSQAEKIYILSENQKFLNGLDLTYLGMGTAYRYKGDYKKALQYLEKALKEIRYNKEDANRFERMRNWGYLSEILYNQFACYKQLYKKNKDKKWLIAAINILEELKALNNWMFQNVAEESSRAIVLRYDGSNAITEGIGLQLLQNNAQPSAEVIQKAFEYAEYSKAQLLNDMMKDKAIKEIAGISNEIRSKESTLLKEITDLQSQILDLDKGTSSDDPALGQLYTQRADKKLDLENLQKRIQQDYPRYAQARNNRTLPSLEEVQKLLPDARSALLEYAVTPDNIYIFLISTSTTRLWEIPVTVQLDSIIQVFYQSISDGNLIRTNYRLASEQYINNGTLLYDILLKTPLHAMPKGIDRLIVIPDAELHYVPFGILLTEKVNSSNPDFRKMPYLFKKYSISYAYSGPLLQQQKAWRNSKQRAKKGLGAFAPTYKNKVTEEDTLGSTTRAMLVRSEFYALEGASEEVKQIKRLIPGNTFTGKRASESSFKQLAGDYQILHLAMHGITDNTNPNLSAVLFTPTDDQTSEDNILHAFEIYNLDLRADLVVLSACNTGYGQLQRGEGLMSLSRAFAYAGAPSMVVSLWKIPDLPTAQIMESFYKFIKKGQSQDQALQNAQLTYLQQTEQAELLHPYFWSGFIQLGDNTALDFPSSNYPQQLPAIIIMLTAILLAVAYFFYGSKKQV